MNPTFTQRAADVIDAFLAVPYYQGLAKGTDDNRRELTRAIVEQLMFEFPDAGYCLKSADWGRPQSKDAIGIIIGGVLYGWDWQNGDTRQRQVQVGQQAEDIHAQNPISVTGRNRLGALQTTPQPPVATVPDDARVRALEAQVAQLQEALGKTTDLAIQVSQLVSKLSQENSRQQDALDRIDSYLATRPIPTGARVGGALGRYVSVGLTFDSK